MGDQIEPCVPAGTFVMSARKISQHGQAILTVVKDGKLDRGDNPYVLLQVPEDFAAYLLHLQEEWRDHNDSLDQAMKKGQ